MNKNKDIKPYNNKGEPHGYWEFYNNDRLVYIGTYHNGDLMGYFEYHKSYGDISKTFIIK